MMKFIEKVGDIKIYAERIKENDDVFIDVMCCNLKSHNQLYIC